MIIDLAKRYDDGEVRVLDTAKLLHGRYTYAIAYALTEGVRCLIDHAEDAAAMRQAAFNSMQR